MLRHGDRQNLVVAVYRDFDLEWGDAGHVIRTDRHIAGSSLIERRFPAELGGGLLERIVDGIAGQRHAALHVNLRGRDVLPHERIKDALIGNQVSAEARGLVVLRHRDRNDLAVFIYRNRNLERSNAGHVILNGSSLRNGFFGNRFGRHFSNRLSSRFRRRLSRRFRERFNRNAVRRSGLLECIIDGIAGQRHAALHIHLSRRQIRANQHRKRFIGQHVCAKTRRFIVVRGADGSNFAAVYFNVHRELVHALHGIRIARRRSSSRVAAKVSRSLLERVIDSVAGQRHAALHVNLRGRDILTHERIKDALVGKKVRAKTRRLIVFRNGNGDNFARVIQLNRNLERTETGHIIGLCATFSFTGSRGLLERIIDGVAGQRYAALHVNLSGCNVLTHQRIKHALVCEEIRTESSSLIVFRHNDGNNLAVAVQRDFHIERRKARHFISASGGLSRSFLIRITAIDGSRFGQNRVLIASMRLNAECALRVGQHLLHRIHKRAGRYSRTRDGIHIIAQRIGISRDCDELLLERVITHAAAKALRLLERADINLRYIAFRAHTKGDRNFSAVTLRIRGQSITLNAAVSILADENFIQHAVVRNTFIRCLLVLAAGKHRIQRGHLGSQLLRLNRAFGDFVGDGQQHGGNKRKDEQTERELHNITHYFLTSPKLLLPVTRSISGEQTFISRMA